MAFKWCLKCLCGDDIERGDPSLNEINNNSSDQIFIKSKKKSIQLRVIYINIIFLNKQYIKVGIYHSTSNPFNS